MKMKIKILVLFILFQSLVACGVENSLGGTEAGNPPIGSRTVSGQVSQSVSNLGRSLLVQIASCPVDTVIAVDSLAQTTIAELDDSCSFSLSLTINKAYAISLVKDDVFVASLVFYNTSRSLESTVMVVGDGSLEISLGLITISGNKATPQNQPASQNDRDDDGSSDYDDEEDDLDCDLDDYPDGYDEDEVCDDDDDNEEDGDDSSENTSGTSEENAFVLEVVPKNDSNLSDEQGLVSPDEDIEVRFSCTIDTDSVNAETFAISDDNGNVLMCEFEYSSSNTRIKCEHDGMEVNTNYTATIDGILCADESFVRATTWNWRTEGD